MKKKNYQFCDNCKGKFTTVELVRSPFEDAVYSFCPACATVFRDECLRGFAETTLQALKLLEAQGLNHAEQLLALRVQIKNQRREFEQDLEDQNDIFQKVMTDTIAGLKKEAKGGKKSTGKKAKQLSGTKRIPTIARSVALG